jgi:hypothetical protein
VPAAAVIREELVLAITTGRKGSVGGYGLVPCESPGHNSGMFKENDQARVKSEVNGILGVHLKWVDIQENFSGEGDLLGLY